VTPSAVVFDFDGTLVESVETKTSAFRELFADEGDCVDAIVDLHLRHGGRSRFEKFAMIFRDILRRQPAPGEIERLGRRFQELVRDAVIACPYVPGAIEFLSRWSSRLPLVVVSGTPHDELTEIIERRRLAPFFTEVHGSPEEKEEILAGLIVRHRWAARQLIVVGDALSDYEAAAHVGAEFVGRVPAGTATPFPPATRIVADIHEFGQWLGGEFSA
jgi:HAD superfamily hydrolase (TIGR01549 family)